MLDIKDLDYHFNDPGARVLVCLEGLYEAVARGALPGTGVEHVFIAS